jgi:soluble lytic murein transglycosylase-like protein
MFGRPHFAAAVFVALAGAGGAVRADVYWYTDPDGGVSLSNVPADDRYRILLPVTGADGVPAGPPRAARVDASPAARGFAALIEQVSRAHGVDGDLLHAVVFVESRYNPKAVSPKGALGLMQLMPATARRYGVVDAFDPLQNLDAGARYLRDLLRLFDNDLELALAAYNAGEQAVLRHGKRIPPYGETRNYVPQVLQFYRSHRS